MEETRAQTSGCPPEHESPRRTTAGTTAAPTQKRAEEGPEGDHPAATMQTSQGGVAASPQVPPAAGHTRADRPWARRSKGPPPPSRGPAKPGGPGPAKQPPRSGQRSPEHPARSEKPPTHRRPGASSTGRAWHHYPQRGNQRQTPELNPLHSGVETGRPPRYPAAAEKTTSPDPDRMASSSSQPPAPDKEQRTGVATRRQRSTTSPASQQHTRTPKPYLYVGVMEREKGSIRDGEEIFGGGKVPPPGASSPLTPIGTPVAPNLPRAGGPGPSRPGPRPIQTGAQAHPDRGPRQPGRPTGPHSRGKLPPPHHSVNSQTTEDNRHPG
ncbi:basic salivary proline-rich protein 4-like [Labeo rohita]|uniref:basic salivary proline-rich protein 4-like n=1 Tax=Labeo rohita TaxID=84645 RepID=UPI0021E25D99|nr:basic salivary proline-rich protein 4-like [Labeo rohita]